MYHSRAAHTNKANPDITNVDCQGNSNGAIRLSPNGGQGNYQFAWSGPNGFSESVKDIENLESGDYTVIITDDMGCSATEIINLLDPEPLEVQFEKQDVNCFGEATGAILARATGGNTPYRYEWENGAISDQISDLTAGDYFITITDGLGCSSERMVTIEEPAEPFNVDFEIQEISCAEENDGVFIFHASGGTPNYSYGVNGNAPKRIPHNVWIKLWGI